MSKNWHKKSKTLAAPIVQTVELKTSETGNATVAPANDDPEKTNAKLPEIPHLKPYVKEAFYGFNIQALLIDMLFIVFSFLVSDEFFAGGGLFDRLKPWQIIAMYCVVVTMLPYYLGYVYVRNSAYFSARVMKVQLWTFVIITGAVLVNLIRLVLTIPDIENLKNDATSFFAVFSMFMIVVGPMMCMGGSMQAYDEFSGKKEDLEKFDANRYAEKGAFFILILAIAFMVYFIGMFSSENSGWAAVVGMFVGPLCAVIVFALFMGFLTLLSKIGVYKYIMIFTKSVSPLFIISVMVFWTGVTMHFMYSDFGNTSGKVSIGAVVFSVLISGVIPFRLIMMFSPPWRLSNVLIGLATMSWFFYSIAKTIS